MSQTVLQLKLTLAESRPPIWRRIWVPGQISLTRLHEIIQAVTGWEDYHLHEFDIAETRYGPEAAPHEVIPVRSEKLVRLHALPLVEGTTFNYVYDFGDHWDIEVKVEKIRPHDPKSPAPSLVDGARAFPPEDSGGITGYEALLEALADPGHPEHDEYRDWVGEDFDPERFDREEANRRLALLA